MQRCLIMCRSLTYAQRANYALERAGITAPVSRAPQGLGANGCGHCLTVDERRLRAALAVLSRAWIPHGKLYRVEAGGSYTEVTA